MKEYVEKMTDATKCLLGLPEGLKRALFDGTLREFDADQFYVGNIYNINHDSLQTNYSEKTKIGNAYFVAFFDRKENSYFIGEEHDIPKFLGEEGVEIFTDLFSLRGQFRADLGPVSKIFSEVEVSNEAIDQ